VVAADTQISITAGLVASIGTSWAQIKEYERQDPGRRALIGLWEDSSRRLHPKVVLVLWAFPHGGKRGSIRGSTNCLIGAVKTFASYYHSDEQAHELRGSFKVDLCAVCFKGSKDESLA